MRAIDATTKKDRDLEVSDDGLRVGFSATDRANLGPPGSHTPLTPSDSTDLATAAEGGGPAASIGFLVVSVSGGSVISYRGATTTSTTVTHDVVAGQYVYGNYSRLMAATTATVVGLAP